jgi:hypothetical protein
MIIEHTNISSHTYLEISHKDNSASIQIHRQENAQIRFSVKKGDIHINNNCLPHKLL